MRSKVFLFSFLILISTTISYGENSKDTKLYNKIITELRCMVCQNQNIAESEAPLAVDLRNKVNSLQKERNTLLSEVSKQRAKAKTELLKNLNPIIQEYMKEKNIRIVLDKKSILLADENLDITKDIVKMLNSKLKSIKLN